MGSSSSPSSSRPPLLDRRLSIGSPHSGFPTPLVSALSTQVEHVAHFHWSLRHSSRFLDCELLRLLWEMQNMSLLRLRRAAPPPVASVLSLPSFSPVSLSMIISALFLSWNWTLLRKTRKSRRELQIILLSSLTGDSCKMHAAPQIALRIPMLLLLSPPAEITTMYDVRVVEACEVSSHCVFFERNAITRRVSCGFMH